MSSNAEDNIASSLDAQELENAEQTPANVTADTPESTENPASNTSSSSSEKADSAPRKPFHMDSKEKDLRKDAAKLLAKVRKLYKKNQKSCAPEVQAQIESAIAELEKSVSATDRSCAADYQKLSKIAADRLKYKPKSGALEVFESLLIALAVAFFIRTFFVEPFKIPTRSMVPTLLEGDQLFVTKLSYGIRLPFYDKYIVRFAEPQRGDVIVFAFPRQDAQKYLAMTNSGCLAAESLSEQKDYIKRVIGIPGDKIEVVDQVVYVNGEPIFQQPFYERTVQGLMFMSDKRHEAWNREKHGDHEYTTITHEMPNNNFGPVIVEKDHVFVMGDNRDNSADSRCWGQVPIDNIKGRAQVIWWSGGALGVRTERMFTSID